MFQHAAAQEDDMDGNNMEEDDEAQEL